MRSTSGTDPGRLLSEVARYRAQNEHWLVHVRYLFPFENRQKEQIFQNLRVYHQRKHTRSTEGERTGILVVVGKAFCSQICDIVATSGNVGLDAATSDSVVDKNLRGERREKLHRYRVRSHSQFLGLSAKSEERKTGWLKASKTTSM